MLFASTTIGRTKQTKDEGDRLGSSSLAREKPIFNAACPLTHCKLSVSVA